MAVAFLSFFFLTSICYASSTTLTFYFGAGTSTVNSVLGYTLNATQTSTARNVSVTQSATTLTLRPTATGTFHENTPVGATPQYECVNEETSNGDTDYVMWDDSTYYAVDAHAMQDTGFGAGYNITQVQVYMLVRSMNNNYRANFKTVLRTHSLLYNGSVQTPPTGYGGLYTTYTTNPNTGTSWTVAEVEAIEVGVAIKAYNSTMIGRCTQIYAVISYYPRLTWGVRVWLTQTPSEATELTWGTPTASVYRSSDSEGLQTGTFTPSETPLYGLPAIEVIVYSQLGSGEWTEKAIFTTEHLSYKSIVDETWSFKLYTKKATTGSMTDYLFWGNSTYATRIDNVAFENYGMWDTMSNYLNSGNFLAWAFTPYTYLLGELFYGILALMIFIGIYNRSENFTYAFIVAILFLGTTGLFTVMVPSVGLGLASVLLVIGGAILFTRLIIALRR